MDRIDRIMMTHNEILTKPDALIKSGFEDKIVFEDVSFQ